LPRSAIKDRQVDPAEARRVSDDVDRDDLLVRELEGQCHKQPSTRSHDNSYSSVHERQLRKPGTPREDERLLGHGPCTAYFPRCARRHSRAVGSHHDIWVEHRKKRGEVTAAGGSQEGFDNFALAGEIGVRDRGCPRTWRRARLASYLAAAG
jgi:hypothetical protein